MPYPNQKECPVCFGDGNICEICGGPISGCSGKHDANRSVELTRIHDNGTWDTVLVELPADTHESQLEAIARMHAQAQYGPGTYMMYNSYDDEVPES